MNLLLTLLGLSMPEDFSTTIFFADQASDYRKKDDKRKEKCFFKKNH